jgi:hypothetical protein
MPIELKVRDKTYTVDIFNNGEFYTQVTNGQQVTALTLEVLKKKLTAMTRKSIEVKFCRYQDGKIVHGIITGKHASNSSFLVKLDGAKGVTQEQSWSASSSQYMDLTEKDEAVLLDLHKRLDSVTRELEIFEDGHEIDIRAEVTKALETSEE